MGRRNGIGGNSRTNFKVPPSYCAASAPPKAFRTARAAVGGKLTISSRSCVVAVCAAWKTIRPSAFPATRRRLGDWPRNGHRSAGGHQINSISFQRETMHEPFWWITKDGDDRARALFDRHYSRQFYRDGRTPKLFCGPGEKIVLRTWDCDALFVWRKFIDDSGQQGINCAVFRNESSHLASELIRQADAVADRCWPGERHYTYVDARRIRSANPGACFRIAGWRKCGTTKGGLLILERLCP